MARVTFTTSQNRTCYECYPADNSYILFVVAPNPTPKGKPGGPITEYESSVKIYTWSGLFPSDIPTEFETEKFEYVPLSNPMADSFAST